MKKIITIVTLSAFFMLTGCDESKTEPSTNDGNKAATIEPSATQNNDGIKADLVALNSIINSSNSKAAMLGNELNEASKEGNQSALKTILDKSKALLETTNQSLNDLTLKNPQVQEIKTGIYQGNMLLIKFYDLYVKEDKTPAENAELAKLQQQAMTSLQSIGTKLNQLNAEYQVQ